MEEYNQIFTRLKVFMDMGVKLSVCGRSSSPESVASMLVKETCEYMPDFIYGDDGNLDEINYDKVVN